MSGLISIWHSGTRGAQLPILMIASARKQNLSATMKRRNEKNVVIAFQFVLVLAF